ncbi:hypothetical protein SDC9_141918 [bioreactor metagenome]|uniref:NAD-specific glutamate dehydrogenase n=1 Tax=bioreactor metagenome TaxID=1076179 RepID=A0A645DZ26_9ZZZZ
MHEGTGILGSLDQVLGRNQLDPGQLGQELGCHPGITDVGVDAGADRRGAKIDLLDQGDGLAESGDVFAHHDRIGRELLPKRHRHGVLQLGTTDLEDVLELRRLGQIGLAQALHGVEQALDGKHHGQLERSGVHVVGALAHVDVVDRMQLLVVAAGPAELFQCEVGDDLVGVHVGRGTRTALDDIDDELPVQPAVGNLATGVFDGTVSGVVQLAKLVVGACCSLLDQ